MFDVRKGRFVTNRYGSAINVWQITNSPLTQQLGSLPTYLKHATDLDLGVGPGQNNLTVATLVGRTQEGDSTLTTGSSYIGTDSLVQKKQQQLHQRGTRVASLGVSVEEKQQLKNRKRDIRGSQLFGLPRQEMSVEMERELKVLQLAAYADPTRHMKHNRSKKLPTHFHVGVTVGGRNLQVGAGSNVVDDLGLVGGKKPKAASFAKELMREDGVQDWTKRRTQVVTDWGQNGKRTSTGQGTQGGKQKVKKAGNKSNFKKNVSWKRKKKR